MRFGYFHNGQYYDATVERYDGGPFRGTAGLSIGHLDIGEGPQDMPADTEQYSYTHGGEQYRAACRAAWAALRAADSGATVVIDGSAGFRPVAREDPRLSSFARLVALARTFPSLADAAKRPIASPEDLEQIARDQSNGSGVRQAAAFLLYVWTSGAYAWDLARGWGAWDDRHRDAWKAWAADPWFG